MKTHVTNLYGFIKDKEVASMQRKFAQTAHDMGIYELGLYVYDVSSDTDSELSKRLDGIIVSVESDDMATGFLYIRMKIATWWIWILKQTIKIKISSVKELQQQ